MAESVYIVAGARTPIGSFLGTLSSKTAPELGAVAIKGALEQAEVEAERIEQVYMGCVLSAGLGQAPARQAMIGAGIPTSTGATTVNKVCGSGLKTVMIGRDEIRSGEANIVVAGGMESMSQAPHLLKGYRTGRKMGHQQLYDALILDGLWDPYDDVHMGNCAELCAEKYQFSRETQDQFSKLSYERSIKSVQEGLFQAEIVPVECSPKKGQVEIVNSDEEPFRVDYTQMSSLKPAFDKAGTVTAGNASSISDGASAVVLASEAAVKQYGLNPMAQIIATATHSQDPAWFTTAPVGAISTVLKKANMNPADIDLYEINEAFAVVVLAAIQELNLDVAKVNVRGGGISLGHPIGASGNRILVTLMHALQQTGKRYGLASLCIGGGEATAVIIENLLR